MGKSTECPICFKSVPVDEIERHADFCADNSSQQEIYQFNSGSPEHVNPTSSIDWDLDSDIYDNGISCSPAEAAQSKRGWNLENSFLDSGPNPSKRKKTSLSSSGVDGSSRSSFELAPYPEKPEKTGTRGCFKNSGNNPGTTIQTLLKARKSPTKQNDVTFPTSDFGSSGKGFKFKLHPFLANSSPISTSPFSTQESPSGSAGGAVVPDGQGGFIINEDALESESDQPGPSLSIPSLSNGFIDFQNQFKENSTPRARKTPKKSPSKKRKSWRRGGGRGRGGRGGARGGRGSRSR